MKDKQHVAMLTILFIASAWVGVGAKQQKNALTVYLPREVTVKATTPTLGEVAIIRGDQALAAKAQAVSLGYMATPEQDLVLTHTVVLSRLACNGISADQVSLTGADQVLIRQQRQLISADQFVQAAIAFLEKNPPHASICRIEPIRTPKEMVLPGTGKDVKFICNLVDSGPPNRCRVRVAVVNQTSEIGFREIPLSLKYQHRRAVTEKAIIKGEAFSADNVRVEMGAADVPEPADWSGPYGLIAARNIPADTVLTQNLVTSPQPEVVIKRNQNVVIKIENIGLIASAVGKAMQDGATGEFIKVKNVDSGIVIMAKVNTDGTVEPVY